MVEVLPLGGLEEALEVEEVKMREVNQVEVVMEAAQKYSEAVEAVM